MSAMASAGYLTTWTFAERLSHLLAFAAATHRLLPVEVAEIELAMDEERRRRHRLADMLLASVQQPEPARQASAEGAA